MKDLCKMFNVKLAKEEMERLFRLANTDKGDRNNKDKGQVISLFTHLIFWINSNGLTQKKIASQDR